MPHFRLTSPAEFTVQFACKVCSSSGAQIFGAQIVHTKEFGGRLPLSSTKCFVLFFFLIIPLPFLFYLNSFISLLPRRLCNSRTKVGSCLLFIHSILSTNQCIAGGEGGGGEAGHGVGIWHFSKICRQIPCPRGNHSSQMQSNFPTAGCTLLSNIPRHDQRKAHWKHLQIKLCNLYLYTFLHNQIHMFLLQLQSRFNHNPCYTA